MVVFLFGSVKMHYRRDQAYDLPIVKAIVPSNYYSVIELYIKYLKPNGEL